MFEGGGEGSRMERKVYDGGDRMEKGRKAGFQEPGGDGVERTGRVGGGTNGSQYFRGRSRGKAGEERWRRRGRGMRIRGRGRGGEKGS